jgi:hypothetical protein
VENNVWGLGIKSWKLLFPSHLNDDTTKRECAPASMALVVRRHCSGGKWALLL